MNGQKQVILEPGDYFASNQQVVLSTLLGSCVSACLYDPVHQVMGMNHFLLGSKNLDNDAPRFISEAARYGVHSMELLINNMLTLGARRGNLKAKAFGGGNVLPPAKGKNYLFLVGEINVRFVRKFLKTEKIPLVSYDLGGEVGRVIHFYPNDYAVFVRKIPSLKSIKIMEREKRFFAKAISGENQAFTDIQIWNQ